MHNSISSMLNKARYLLQQNTEAEAVKLCQAILKQDPSHAEALQLCALGLKHASPAKADVYFRKSLQCSPNNSYFLGNYANFLAGTNRDDLAESMYKKALSLEPRNHDTAFNFAVLLGSRHRYQHAILLLSKQLSLGAKQARFYSLLITYSEKVYQYEDALAYCMAGLRIDSSNYQLRLQHAQLLRELSKPREALALLKNLREQFPKSAEIHYLIGCIYFDLQQYHEAETALNGAISLAPDFLDAHKALNKLLWENGDERKFLVSFAQARAQVSNPLRLWLAEVEHLISSQHLAAAEQILSDLEKSNQQQPDILYFQSLVSTAQGAYEQALAKLKLARKKRPSHTRYLIDEAAIYIRTEQYKRALSLLDLAQKAAPDNQEIIAYQALCWRLLGNEQYDWLYNTEQFVRPLQLETPAGYGTLTDFMDELKLLISGLHNAKNQPIDQSVRNGTQTVGRLFSSQHPLITQYQNALRNAIQCYLDRLPQDKRHPLLRRNTGKFNFSGSWSVQLLRDGYHSNHIHPAGWLSVCTYLEVPPAICPEDPAKSGWLKFGESCLALGDKESIIKTVCPEQGMSIIFPSYYWHGTNPLCADKPRITLPCDIAPI